MSEKDDLTPIYKLQNTEVHPPEEVQIEQEVSTTEPVQELSNDFTFAAPEFTAQTQIPSNDEPLQESEPLLGEALAPIDSSFAEELNVTSDLNIEGTVVSKTQTIKIDPETSPDTRTLLATPTSITNIQKSAETPVVNFVPPVTPKADHRILTPLHPINIEIIGELSEPDKSKLLRFIQDEKLGISEFDLELQFERHHILLPQVTEYVAYIIAHMIKETSARIVIHDHEQPIIAQPETTTKPAFNHIPQQEVIHSNHPAWTLPVSTQSLSDLDEAIDVISGNMTFESNELEPQKSRQFQEYLEALQNRLKFLAYRKGAREIKDFKYTIISVPHSNEFKLIASGTALK